MKEEKMEVKKTPDYVSHMNDLMPGAALIVKADGAGTGEILYANEDLLSLFECDSLDQLKKEYGGTFIGLVYPLDAESFRWFIRTRMQRNAADTAASSFRENIIRMHYRIQTRSGKIIRVFDLIKYHDDPEEGKLAFCIILPSEMNENNTDMDRVTSLMGMRRFLDEAEKASARRKGEKAYYIYFNIAHFKRYNMQHGLDEGDNFLRKASGILKDCFPCDTLIARFAADHFAVYTTDPKYLSYISDAHARVSQIRPEATAELKAGVYIDSCPENRVAVNAACDLAKIACDSIGDKADQYVRIYDQKTADEIELRTYISENIETAIANGWIKVYYQPVVRTISHTLCSFEALTRWNDPRYGFLSPGIFIPVLEESRQIHKLDLYVLEQVCRRIHDLREKGEAAVPASFNLSRVDFVMVDVFAEVEKMVKRYQIPRDMIRIEITESTVMQDKKRMAEWIAQFRQAGYQVWMDDFGSGYSSLNMLKDFHFDEIKLDMDFLRSFSDASRKIVRATIQMAKSLHIHTLAEGVETAEQADFLASIGCEKMQGYYFGRPAPFEECLAHCEKEKGLRIETRASSRYLEKVGEVNMQTEQAMVLVDYRGRGKFHMFYINDPCQKLFQNLGYDSLEEFLKTARKDHFLSYYKIADYLDNSGKMNSPISSHPFYLTIHGHYICLDFHMLVSEKGHTAYEIFISDLTRQEETAVSGEKIDSVLRNILVFYDSICLFHFDADYYEIIYKGPLFDGVSGVKYDDLPREVDHFTRKFVYAPDQKRFRNFMKMDTLAERVRKSVNSCLLGQFRLLTAAGNYTWKLCSIFLLPDEDENVGLFCIRNSILANDPDAVQIYSTRFDAGQIASLSRRYASLQDEKREHHADPAGMDTVLHAEDWGTGRVYESEAEMKRETSELGQYALAILTNLNEALPLNLYWKDTALRYLGASRLCLEKMGISSSELIGKTDQDLSLGITDRSFREKEKSVLQGSRLDHVAGTAVIHGQERRIAVSEAPIYYDGRIVGLLGCFEDADHKDGRQ
jgi:diguanylate cyclase (GGDEF)-like protein